MIMIKTLRGEEKDEWKKDDIKVGKKIINSKWSFKGLKKGYASLVNE